MSCEGSVLGIVSNNYKVQVGHVSVSANNIMSFVLKEESPEKVPSKNTYIIKVQGIEMNNLSRVDKVKIEEGVYQFFIDLTEIVPALQTGSNTLEVEGTANMLVCGTGLLQGLYGLSCGQPTLSIYSQSGIYLPPGTNVSTELAGCYTRRVVDSSTVIYEKYSNSNKYIIFFYAPHNRWYIKQTISNGSPTGVIFFQQRSLGTSVEVPLNDWAFYGRSTRDVRCGFANAKLGMKSCIPYSTTKIILVNCGGIDDANAVYYKDEDNGRFINIRNSNYVITFHTNQDTAQSYWQIQDNSTIDESGSATILYKSISFQSTGNISCSCIPCADWIKQVNSSPGDPPQITALEYFDTENPENNIRYFDDISSTWTLYEGNTKIATGTSDHYIVSRAPSVNGAYCLTCVNPDNCPDYTLVSDSSVVLGYNVPSQRWELRTSTTPGTDVLYFANSTDSSVPPFDDWVALDGSDDETPLVLSSVIPSCVTWTLL